MRDSDNRVGDILKELKLRSEEDSNTNWYSTRLPKNSNSHREEKYFKLKDNSVIWDFNSFLI